MKKIGLLVISVFCLQIAVGQSVFEQPSVTSLVEDYIAANKSKDSFKGWRALIVVSGDRRQIEAAKRKFRIAFPDIPIQWKYQEPLYKLMAGAYQGKHECQAELRLIKEEFPDAFEVQDELKYREILERIEKQ